MKIFSRTSSRSFGSGMSREQLDRDLVEDPERGVQARQLLGPELRVPRLLVRAQRGPCEDWRNVVLRRLSSSLRVDDDARRRLLDDVDERLAELDPVAGREHHGVGDPRAVQRRAVPRAEVDEADGPPSALRAARGRGRASGRPSGTSFVEERPSVRTGRSSRSRRAGSPGTRTFRTSTRRSLATPSGSARRFADEPARAILRGSAPAHHAAGRDEEPHEGEDPPRVPRGHRPLRLREHLEDAEHEDRAAPRDLLELPPVLHGQGEARRHRRPRRALPEALREPPRPRPPRPKSARRARRHDACSRRPSRAARAASTMFQKLDEIERKYAELEGALGSRPRSLAGPRRVRRRPSGR